MWSLGENKRGKTAGKENQMDRKARGMGKWCIMLARESQKSESGIKASTESPLINDMHSVMCRLV